MLLRLMHSPVAFLTFFLLLLTSGDGGLTSSASPHAAPAKHGLTGSYYVANVALDSDIIGKTLLSQDFYSQVWFDPNDFYLPRTVRNLQSPAAVRVDPQIAFGIGQGFVLR